MESNCNVASLDRHRVERAAREENEVAAVIRMIDEATRDAHHASSAALKLMHLARRRLGLVDLPMP